MSATDEDGGTLSYSLAGTDAASFRVVSTSGQLQTMADIMYDYETKSSYSVTVRVEDGQGGSAIIDVPITLTDETEPPGKPDAPAVTTSTLNSLALEWTAPTNSGPAITDYDVQYKESGGEFADWEHIGTGLTTTITNLKRNASYEVQVRAHNAEGTSDWSDVSHRDDHSQSVTDVQRGVAESQLCREHRSGTRHWDPCECDRRGWGHTEL